MGIDIQRKVEGKSTKERDSMTFQNRWDSKMTTDTDIFLHSMKAPRYFVVMTLSGHGSITRYALTLVGKGKRFGKVFDLVPRYVRMDSNRAKLTTQAIELNKKILERIQ